MKRIVEVTVWVPAFNEEKNIQNVIKQILSQKESYWRLKNLIVVCDGSEDNTIALAEKIKDKRIRIIEGSKNLGKVRRLNQVAKNFDADVLVQIDADVTFKDNNVISLLVKEFRNDRNTKLVGGNSKVFPPNNFFQKSINTSYEVYYRSRNMIDGGHNIFGCTGAILAMKKELVNEIHIPQEVIAEDTYLFFLNKSLGFDFRHAKDAIVYFKMAGNLKDFLKQVFRSHPESIEYMFEEYFGKAVGKEYQRPRKFYLKSILKIFIEQPVYTVTMIAIKILCIPMFPILSSRYQKEWFTAASTK